MLPYKYAVYAKYRCTMKYNDNFLQHLINMFGNIDSSLFYPWVLFEDANGEMHFYAKFIGKPNVKEINRWLIYDDDPCRRRKIFPYTIGTFKLLENITTIENFYSSSKKVYFKGIEVGKLNDSSRTTEQLPNDLVVSVNK